MNRARPFHSANQTPAQRALRLEYLTVGWNSVEAAVAVASGIIAASVALTAFGIDSAIEVVSATIVAARLRALLAGGEPDERKERRALRIIAGCFFALAAYVLTDASLSLASSDRPRTSPAGIAITAAALIIMPSLAYAKRQAANRLQQTGQPGPAALVLADSAETALCALLSATTLLGIGLDAAMGWWWADPIASLAVAFLAIKEGTEAWQGDIDCSGDD